MEALNPFFWFQEPIVDSSDRNLITDEQMRQLQEELQQYNVLFRRLNVQLIRLEGQMQLLSALIQMVARQIRHQAEPSQQNSLSLQHQELCQRQSLVRVQINDLSRQKMECIRERDELIQRLQNL